MKKVKKITIIPDNKNNFVLLGISSQEPDYKVSWYISSMLNIKLSKSDDILVVSKTNEKLSFSVFADNTDYFRLISNHCNGKTLFKEIQNIDYIFQINSELTSVELNRTQLLLKETEGITGVFRIDLKKIKNIENITI